jgi:endonuclease/exonuclease/phosphatase (EEP) superfamily protein YafD
MVNRRSVGDGLDSDGASNAPKQVHRRPLIAGTLVALLCVCAVIAICRVLAPRNLAMVGLGAMSPLAAILAGVAVVLCLSIIAQRRAPVVGWALLLGVALLIINLVWLAPSVGGGQPPRPPGAVPVRVMSINMLGGRADAAQIVRAAQRGDVDVLVATEITDGGLRNLHDAGVSGVLPYRYGQAAPSPAGTMVFLRERAEHILPLRTRLVAVALTTSIRSHPVRLLAAHPAAPTDFELWRSDLDTISEAVHDRSVDLLVGDLNATTDNKPLRDVMARGRYRDAAELANIGWEPTFPANGVRRRLGIPIPAILPIDHVLVRDDGGADRVRLVDIAGTDHAGVIADIWIPATERT